ncbi:hypothetical protein [Paenibacillus timonensis]|uniref:hypothetical protein n=1 Tax=Paenibacillus timonensis TaxID=225915 RepID=UPI003F9970B4
MNIHEFISNKGLSALEQDVNRQLCADFSFMAEEECLLGVDSDSYTYFMPFFTVTVKCDLPFLNEMIVNTIANRFEVAEWQAANGDISVTCIADEGPLAETTEQIVSNIHELLGPATIEAFKAMKIPFTNACFILSLYRN